MGKGRWGGGNQSVPTPLDLIIWLFGLPHKVCAKIKIGVDRNILVENELSCMQIHENETIGSLIISTHDKIGVNKLVVFSSEARLVVCPTAIIYENKTTGVKSRILLEEIDLEFANDKYKGHQRLINEFIDSIITGRNINTGYQEGKKQLEFSNAIYMSDWLNGWVELPVNSQKYKDLLERKIFDERLAKNKRI